jgi:outer membrane protein TolC
VRETATRQVAVGESSPLVRLVADADLAQTRAALIETSQFEQSTRAALAALIGWSETELPAMEGALPPIRRAPEARALLAMMMARHPSVQVRALATEAGKARQTLAEREA